MRKAPNEITVLTRGRGGSSSGIPQSAEAVGDPSIRVGETDLSLDAKNTMIASDRLRAASGVATRSAAVHRRRTNLKSNSKNTLMAAKHPAAVIGLTSAERGVGGGGWHQVVGGSAGQRPGPAADPPGGQRWLSGSPSSR